MGGRAGQASAQPVEDAAGPTFEQMREFMGPWMRTRESYGPVWWPEFRRLTGTSIDRTQFNLLRLIAHGPSRPLKELATAAMMPTSTASRLVEALVQQGLVERIVPSSDRRVTLVATTAAGSDLIAESEHIGASLLAGPFAGFDDEAIRTFTEVFTRLAAVIEEWAQEPQQWCRDAAARRGRPDG